MLMPTDIKYYQEFGGEKVVFEKEEIAEMKKFADPGVRTARGERAGGSTTVRGNPQDWNLGVQKGCTFLPQNYFIYCSHRADSDGLQTTFQAQETLLHQTVQLHLP